ncbi:MAG TPA: ABC transporter ATP-binding protein [Planctomycetota bacterium]|nr:ABC transporter ATP-binding protein [Planctomycetota bacterium]
MNASLPLVVRGLRKSYGATVAVDDLSFEVRRGECFGLLGPNGAGKSTTLSIVTTLVEPDAGDVLVEGVAVSDAPDAARRNLGVAPQELAVYEELTAAENLAFFGRLYGLRGNELAARVDASLRAARLEDRRAHRVETFSGGMKRRLNFAAAMVHDPRVLLLDEPTAGVDPQSRHHLFEMVAEAKARGVTTVYTTHYMEEAERLCDRIAIMDRGRLVACGTRDELTALAGGRDEARLTFADGVSPAAAEAAFADLGGRMVGDAAAIPVAGVAGLADLLARAERARLPVRSVTLKKPDLETTFLALTGRALRD